jgi:hypothetical protein
LFNQDFVEFTMLQHLINALNLANTEALVVAMPEAIVHDISDAALKRWGALKTDVVGKVLMKFGTGTLSARQLGTPATPGAPPEVEVSYAPPLGKALSGKFKAQTIDQDGKSFSVLLVNMQVKTRQQPSSTTNAD